MLRLYVDEHGTASLTHLDKDKHRYLSLTGVAIDTQHASATLEPNMNWIKSHVLNHDPDDPAILHRTDIMGGKGIFGRLSSDEMRDKFDRSLIRLFESTDFKIITAIIDKKAMLKNPHWQIKDPYHYLMEILVEKYVQLLERKCCIGDIMPEKRGGSADDQLQEAFIRVRSKGTHFVSSTRITSALRGDKLKFRWKKENIAGLQFCDLLAQPSHIFARELIGHDVAVGVFSSKIKGILFKTKYDRSASGRILGYGIKWAS